MLFIELQRGKSSDGVLCSVCTPLPQSQLLHSVRGTFVFNYVTVGSFLAGDGLFREGPRVNKSVTLSTRTALKESVSAPPQN